jgi:murein L,D-transpeptidase YafK
MKIQNLSNGTMIIIFDKNEVDEICKSNQMNLNLQESENLEIEKDDPFKSLREKTVSFIKDLHKKYGNNEINVKSDYVKDARRKYFITDIETSLRTLVQRNVCKINYTQNGKRRRMFSIKFNL